MSDDLPLGFVRLTPDLMKSMAKSLKERTADIAARYPDLVAGCPPETRLAVAAWVFEALAKHGEEGGTFRHLIYGRLGFGTDAYLPLYNAGGMTISNWLFDAADKDGECAMLRAEVARLRQAAGEKPDAPPDLDGERENPDV